MVAGITMSLPPLPRRHLRRRRRRHRLFGETGAPSQVMSRSAKQTHPLRTDPRSDLSFNQYDVILTVRCTPRDKI